MFSFLMFRFSIHTSFFDVVRHRTQDPIDVLISNHHFGNLKLYPDFKKNSSLGVWSRDLTAGAVISFVWSKVAGFYQKKPEKRISVALK